MSSDRDFRELRSPAAEYPPAVSRDLPGRQPAQHASAAAGVRRSFREETKLRLRDAVLDATVAKTAALGWKQVRLADIAEEVGVSRQTIYNEFGSKEGLGQALVLRETEAFLEGTLWHLAEHRTDLVTGVTAAATFALCRAEDNPLLRAILVNARGGEDELLPMLTTRSEPILRLAAEALTEFIVEHLPDRDRTEVSMGAESVVRLIVSHLVLPLHSTEEFAAHIATLVERYLQLPPVAAVGAPDLPARRAGGGPGRG